MFVNNKTRYPVALPRGELLDGVFVAAVVATLSYRHTPTGLEWIEAKRDASPEDPPPLTDRPLWQGTSVTVSGTVEGPGRAPHAAKVTLRVGDASRSLVVFGDRRWVKNAGKLVPSVPAAWDSLPLSWRLSFGGAVDVPPGPLGPRKLPHPGGRVPHAQNPQGKGFCLDDAKAEGVQLPNIESPTELLRQPTDQPRPVGFAPCPDLPGLRVRGDEAEADRQDPRRFIPVALRFMHPATSELIFRDLPSGTRVELSGMRRSPVGFEIPAPPFAVAVRKGQSRSSLGGFVRHVHIAADEDTVLVTYGFPFAYEAAPSWVDVTPVLGG